ncbi:MAG: hypothetical protein F4Y45_05895 [Acidobacteria bacterium]|nr:hypothetical protein [Acidobacteriota bacterium]MYJ03452.1 hypothetical protein [Acidobacteriota bacterium]
MAEPTSSPDDLFAMWRKQVEAGTEAWVKAAQQMTSQGQVPNPPDPTQFWRQFSSFGMPGASPFPGTGPIDPDVLAQWKRFLDEWLAAWSRALEQVMQTEEFAQALGKTLDQFLNVQAKARQATESTTKTVIDSLGLPSRDQVVGLSRQMMDLEDRIESLADKLDALAARPPAAAAPAATTPPAAAPKAAGPAPPKAAGSAPRRRPTRRKPAGGAKTPKKPA